MKARRMKKLLNRGFPGGQALLILIATACMIGNMPVFEKYARSTARESEKSRAILG